MQTAAQRTPAKPQGEQVIVGCKLPFGVVIHAGQKWSTDAQVCEEDGEGRTLNGRDHPSAIYGFGITSVDKDFWDTWVAEQKGRNLALRNGFIFAAPKHDDVKAAAKERENERNGFEGLDFDKPMEGIEPDKEAMRNRENAN